MSFDLDLVLYIWLSFANSRTDRRSQWLGSWAPGESAASYFLTQTNNKFGLETAEAEACRSPLKDALCYFLTVGAFVSVEKLGQLQ